MSTRIADICLSLIGLLVLVICYPFVALMIKHDSRGPVFYKCNRVGLNGKIFKMYKFRTMYEMPVVLGPSVSPLGDPRVTPGGRLLRRLKLNEFPQFINVFKGEMTLIGPRPESPDLAAAYPEDAKRIFTVKPGLIGPNQIMGRNEEESYPPGVDPNKYYIEILLPRKLPIDLQYIENPSFFNNFKLFSVHLGDPDWGPESAPPTGQLDPNLATRGRYASLPCLLYLGSPGAIRGIWSARRSCPFLSNPAICGGNSTPFLYSLRLLPNHDSLSLPLGYQAGHQRGRHLQSGFDCGCPFSSISAGVTLVRFFLLTGSASSSSWQATGYWPGNIGSTRGAKPSPATKKLMC